MRRLPGFTPTRSSFANPLRLSELVRPFAIGSGMTPPAPRDRLAAGDSRTDPKRRRKMRARHPVPLAHARVGQRRCSVNRAAHARSMPSVLRFPRSRTSPTCRPTDGLSGRTSVRAVATCPSPKHILGTTEQPSPTATTLFIGSTLSNSINGFGGGPAGAHPPPPPPPKRRPLVDEDQRAAGKKCRRHLFRHLRHLGGQNGDELILEQRGHLERRILDG